MSTATANKPNSTPKDLAKAGSNGKAIEVAAEEPKKATDQFVAKIQRNFQGAGELGVRWSDLQARLAQHLAVKIEMALDQHEIKRAKNPQKKNDPPFTWANVNMEALTIKAKNLIDLELDAAMPNHVHVVPYLNSRTQKYDVDLRIGYEGLVYTKPKFATVTPLDISFKLVYDGDEFDIETNEFGGEKPVHKRRTFFPPADEVAIGGYGWIRYEKEAMDKVIVVDAYEFEKALKAAMSTDFWGGMIQERKWDNSANGGKGGYVNVGEPKWDPKVRRDMQLKTVITRTMKHIKLDPAKVNADTWISVEEPDLEAIEVEVTNDIADNANRKELPPPDAANTTVDPVTGEVTGATQEGGQLF